MNNTPSLLARLWAAVVLAAPLALFGVTNEDIIDSSLKLEKYVAPAFPAAVRQEGVPEGAVSLAISRDAAGVPTDVLVLEATHPKLAEAAVAAVRQWRFAAADGGSGSSPVVVHLGFRLSGVVFLRSFGTDLVAAHNDQGDIVRVPRLQALAQAPKALNQPMPQYPAALTGRAVEGTAAVKFYVDEDGNVRMPTVVEATTPEFAAAALAAVSQWRYEPPRIGAHRIVASDHWSFKFAATN